jgi:hypothetical protein
MSKKAKSAAKDKRRSLKKSRKAAMKTQYQAWAASGQNSSKRSKLRAKKNAKKRLATVSHTDGPCGNIGCSKCNPMDYNLLSPRLLAAQERKNQSKRPIRIALPFHHLDEKPTLLGANFLN